MESQQFLAVVPVSTLQHRHHLPSSMIRIIATTIITTSISDTTPMPPPPILSMDTLTPICHLGGGLMMGRDRPIIAILGKSQIFTPQVVVAMMDSWAREMNITPEMGPMTARIIHKTVSSVYAFNMFLYTDWWSGLCAEVLHAMLYFCVLFAYTLVREEKVYCVFCLCLCMTSECVTNMTDTLFILCVVVYACISQF